jgi:hypothetical protein
VSIDPYITRIPHSQSPSFSELMPILLNVIIGVPQMLSNIQYVFIRRPFFRC